MAAAETVLQLSASTRGLAEGLLKHSSFVASSSEAALDAVVSSMRSS